ncbi:fructose-bisphosphate aldolase class I [Candidatus Saccharibacteria bacterium]|nr:fructose-bisphosphate aldolase class I [Candidatus Saccharibacteria bacterium]
MSVLIVGNITDDVYINLDSRLEHLETDKNNVKWLDLAFNASEHHYFNHDNSLGGAAISLEVLQKLGVPTSISNSKLNFDENTNLSADITLAHRYILINDDAVTYFAPSKFKDTIFTPPTEIIDYLYIDRSATLDYSTTEAIKSYIETNPDTGLILYLQHLENPYLNSLLPEASLVFCEKLSEIKTAPEYSSSPLKDLDPEIIIDIAETHLAYQGIKEKISIHNIDMFTHLSIYSIASATVLGCFILGYSVEESLAFARINLEHSSLDSTLSLEQLKSHFESYTSTDNLNLIATSLVLKPKGILAADESGGSIHKKFEQLNIPDTFENRRDYRNIFFTTKDLEKYVNGVILFDETARQTADDGQNFVQYLTDRRIIPGIKVDQGLEKFSDSAPQNAPEDAKVHPDETWTKGLDALDSRLREYYDMGLRFTKWRAAFEIRLDKDGNILTPTDSAIEINCDILADYAHECQKAGLVPIVEPEVVYDGFYTTDQNSSTTAKILDCLFQKLSDKNVDLSACILKVNMILAGKQYETQSTPEEVGEQTAKVLKDHVPAELAGVVFLSGGQTVEQATDNLAAVTKNGPFPWPVTFSFARALQDPALYAWAGDNNNADAARDAFLARLIANTNALKS